jgi:hypothetical protein
MSPLIINHTFTAPIPVSGITATAVNQVVPSPNSALAFLTYNGVTANAPLPYYISGSGAMNYLTLSNSAAITAPVAGAFSPDDQLFFVSTAGDNLIHYISVPDVISNLTAPASQQVNPDTQQIAPNLPSCTVGGTDLGCTYTGTDSVVPATAIIVKPRSTT